MKVKQTMLAATLAALGALPLLAAAQTSRSTGPSRSMTASTADSYSLLPGTTRGYVGASAGVPDFDLGCTAGFQCDDPNIGFKVFTGGSWSEMFGVEIGYLNFGKKDRAGGESEAQGVNLSLVGNLPLTETFNVFARVGTTWSWSDVSASPFAVGVRTGDEKGFGLAYGAGIGMDLTRNWSLIAEWEQHRVQFVGGDNDVSMASVGVKYRF